MVNSYWLQPSTWAVVMKKEHPAIFAYHGWTNQAPRERHGPRWNSSLQHVVLPCRWCWETTRLLDWRWLWRHRQEKRKWLGWSRKRHVQKPHIKNASRSKSWWFGEYDGCEKLPGGKVWKRSTWTLKFLQGRILLTNMLLIRYNRLMSKFRKGDLELPDDAEELWKSMDIRCKDGFVPSRNLRAALNKKKGRATGFKVSPATNLAGSKRIQSDT